jgi:hypothetical protein
MDRGKHQEVEMQIDWEKAKPPRWFDRLLCALGWLLALLMLWCAGEVVVSYDRALNNPNDPVPVSAPNAYRQ